MAPPLAPRWHTALLVALMVTVAIAGFLGAPAEPSSTLLGVYLPMIAVQWGLAIYVCRIGRPRNALGALLGERWSTVRRATVNLVLAAALVVVILAVESVYVTWHGAASGAFLPRSVEEHLVWIIVAFSAGVSEELVYRGYLLRQLTAFTRRPLVALVASSLLFGLAHGSQGVAAVVRFAFYGALFAALAVGRRSLLPGIVAHVSLDLLAGL